VRQPWQGWPEAVEQVTRCRSVDIARTDSGCFFTLCRNEDWRANCGLLHPKPLSARTAYDWGVVTEVVRDGEALSRAIELAYSHLKVPEITRRNTRVHFSSRARLPDVVCDLLHGRKPYVAFGLDVRDQPIELHDPRSASADMRMLSEDEHRPFLKGEIELGLVDLEHRIR